MLLVPLVSARGHVSRHTSSLARADSCFPTVPVPLPCRPPGACCSPPLGNGDQAMLVVEKYYHCVWVSTVHFEQGQIGDWLVACLLA